MAYYYLHVEAVNLDNVLADTQNISVIRGSSLLLRQAIRDIEKEYFDEESCISSGASAGLFRFQADMESDAAQKRQAVVDYLNSELHYQHFTFVVNIQAANKFAEAKEKLLAKNRFQQMQQLSVVMPEPSQNQAVCGLDNLRPANKTDYIKKERLSVSASVYQRRQHGREQRQDFYEQETGLSGYQFTNDLNTLATLEKQKLNNKIAVFYCDGNGFGEIQREHCQTAEALRKFDSTIQTYRREFLTAFLEWANEQDDFRTKDNELRLETLLWGGDEFTLVVPAWHGLATVDFFYSFTEQWQFADKPLTHAGGLVFAHAKAPIQRVQKLAKDLAERVKDYPSGKTANYLEYAVLESIDFPTESLQDFHKGLFCHLADSRPLLTPLDAEMRVRAVQLQKILSKGQVYALARAALKPDTEFEAQLKQLLKVTDFPNAPKDKRQALQQHLDAIFPQTDLTWQCLHLVDLWDYVGGDENNE
jgi:hypothetical protein